MLMDIPTQSSNDTQYLQSKITALTEQNQALSAQCSLLSNEADRFNALLKEKDLEISSLKQTSNGTLQVQTSQKVPTEAEVRALKILIQDSEKRIVSLLNENKRLTESLSQKEEENKQKVMNGSNEMNGGIVDHEKTIAELTQELNLWKIKYDNLTIKSEEEFRRYKTDTERTLKIQTEESLKARAQAFDNERREYNEMIKSFKEKFFDFEKKLLVVMQENEKFCAELTEKEREIEVLKQQNVNQTETGELIRRLADTNARAESEKSGLLRKLEEAEAKDILLKTEIERINNRIYERDTENEQLRKKLKDNENKFFIELTKKDNEIEVVKKQNANQTETGELIRRLADTNARAESERLSLLRKLEEAEAKDTLLKTEIERINNRIYERDTENEQLRKKLKENENKFFVELTKKENEIELLKKQNVNQTEISEVIRKLTETNARVESERLDLLRKLEEAEAKDTLLKTEIERANNKIYERDTENEQLRKKLRDSERNAQIHIDKTLAGIEQQFKQRLLKEKEEYDALALAEKQQNEKQINLYIRKVQELEAQMTLLISNNQTLSFEVQQKNEEIKAAKVKFDLVVNEKENLLSGLRATMEDEKRIQLEKDIKVVEAQFKDRINLYEDLLKGLTLKIQDFEQRQILFFIEIERLYRINSDLIDDLNKLSREAKSLNHENNELNNNITEVNQAFLTLSENKTKLERIVGELTRRIEDYDKRNQTLLSENARLRDLSVSQLKEIDDLKLSFSSSVSTQEDLRASRQMESLKKAHNDLREMALMFEAEKNNTDKQLAQLKHIIDLNRAEIVRLQEVNNQRQAENEELRSEMEISRSSSGIIVQLKEELRSKVQQNEVFRKEIEDVRRMRDFFQQQLEQISLKEQTLNKEGLRY